MIDLHQLSDDELILQAREGSDDAFGELMRRNSSATRKLAASVLRDVHEAEDAVQDAWSKAWQHIARFHGDSKFSTWFTRIVINQCLMRLRTRRRKPVVPIDETVQHVADEGATPESFLSQDEIRALVRKEVALLPPLLRDTLMLRDFDQLPIEAVALRLQVSIPAAKSRLLRARAELRRRLERHLGPFPTAALL